MSSEDDKSSKKSFPRGRRSSVAPPPGLGF